MSQAATSPTSVSSGSEVASFGAKDIVVSRTDHRGVILAANEVFLRVSGYTWEEVENAPQKIVRHPDMPKGVFWLLWHRLQAGQPVGAFVKNRAKDGCYYWVFALMAAQDDGYVSVRIKPTADKLALVEPLYARLLQRERQENLTPEQSAQLLLEALPELGFQNYPDFMAQMALDQCAERAALIDAPHSRLGDDLGRLTKIWREVRGLCTDIYDAHCGIAHTPANLRVQAAHLMDAGIALSEIASNFTTLATEITEMMTVFIEKSHEVEAALDNAAFQVTLEHLMHEVVDIFKEDAERLGDSGRAKEIDIMTRQRNHCFKTAVAQVHDVRSAVFSFSGIIEETKRVLSGLSVAKVMCEIENAYVGVEANSGITATIAELDSFQVGAREKLYVVRRLLFQAESVIKRAERRLGMALAA